MPGRLVRHTSGCVCHSIFRDDQIIRDWPNELIDLIYNWFIIRCYIWQVKDGGRHLTSSWIPSLPPVHNENFLPHVSTVMMVPSNHGLNLLKRWAKINPSSLKFFLYLVTTVRKRTHTQLSFQVERGQVSWVSKQDGSGTECWVCDSDPMSCDEQYKVLSCTQEICLLPQLLFLCLRISDLLRKCALCCIFYLAYWSLL